MRTFFYILLTLSVCFQLIAQEKLPIVPYPQHVAQTAGSFRLDPCTRLLFSPSAKSSDLTHALQPLLDQALKQGITLLDQPCTSGGNTIRIVLSETIPAEGYELVVEPSQIILSASSPTGVFYGLQTLLQIWPESTQSNTKRASMQLPAVHITDYPAFSYRGVMLDVARHYMPIDSIKRILDGMALQKMNRFHWHLTDSQGWRFESKAYPNLTKVGAYRKGTPLNTTYEYNSRPQDTLYGGFYTQEAMRELVRYAQDRFITIIPEIEMPAHSRSALASYPQLACSDSLGVLLPNAASIGDDSYCTKDETFMFLEGILTEVMDVFPSPLIHIGGDEAPRQNWKTCAHCRNRMRSEGLKNEAELQSYFIKRIERFVSSKGRQIIGWDEILDGGLAPNAIVMSWRGTEGGITAAKSGHQAVMTPGSHCYFDHYQSDDSDEPLAWGGLTTLEKVYTYDPIPEALTPEEARFIAGAQGNLWTEFVPTYRQATYMLFPRSTALSEVLWTYDKSRNYADFIQRLEAFSKKLQALGVQESPHRYMLRLSTEKIDNTYHVRVSGVTPGVPVHYTTDESRPTLQSPLYTNPLPLAGSSRFTAAVLTAEGSLRDKVTRRITLHPGMEAETTLEFSPSNYYSKGGIRAWTDGVSGSDANFADDQWLGWNNHPFIATLDFGSSKQITSISTRFFHKPQSWIWVPERVEILASKDGRTYRTVHIGKPTIQRDNGPNAYTAHFRRIKTRYMRVRIMPLKQIPDNFNGAGEAPWLFVDEVEIGTLRQ